MSEPYRVLFLCTGNSARSILAEALLNAHGGGRFQAFSAGSHPTGRVNPATLEWLTAAGLPTEGLRSKSWEEFARPGAPALDFVFTVCDAAAGELCPVWPGRPVTAHWGVEDPAAVQGEEPRRRAFARAAHCLLDRIRAFTRLPLEALEAPALRRALEAIGRSAPEGEA